MKRLSFDTEVLCLTAIFSHNIQTVTIKLQCNSIKNER